MSKRANDRYEPDRRTWFKIKCLNREEFVVVGSEANLHYAADDPPAEDDPSCASSVFQTWLHSRVDPQRAGTIF